MNYLLDTHIAIWFILGNQKLPQKVITIIQNNDNRKYISIASIWEMAIKIRLGKLDFSGGTVGFVKELYRNGIEILPIAVECVYLIETLELHHSDPFDRIIIATAMSKKMTLLSSDAHFQPYTKDSLTLLNQ